jgi:Ice-binding-like
MVWRYTDGYAVNVWGGQPPNAADAPATAHRRALVGRVAAAVAVHCSPGRQHQMLKPNRLAAALVFAIMLGAANGPLFSVSAAPLAATSPTLGAAARFVVLAGTLISNVPTSAITGDIGLSPATGAGITGFTCAQVTGTIYSIDASPALACMLTNPGLLTTAKNDLITAYDGLAAGGNATCTTDYGVGPQDLTSVSPLGPGVYCVGAGGFGLSGNLTLTGSGVWIFRSAATIITSPGSSVTGSDPCNVWWRAETSATLDTTTAFIGNILALASIGMNTGATLNGRALARNGAVTLQSNTITGRPCLPAARATPTVTATSTTTTTPTGTPTATATGTPPSSPTPAPTATATQLAPTPQNTAVPAPTETPLPAPTETATAPAVVGLPATGGGPLPGPAFPWTQALVAGGLGIIAVGLGVRGYRRRAQRPAR